MRRDQTLDHAQVAFLELQRRLHRLHRPEEVVDVDVLLFELLVVFEEPSELPQTVLRNLLDRDVVAVEARRGRQAGTHAVLAVELHERRSPLGEDQVGEGRGGSGGVEHAPDGMGGCDMDIPEPGHGSDESVPPVNAAPVDTLPRVDGVVDGPPHPLT